MAVNRLLKTKPDVSRAVASLICVAAALLCLAYGCWRNTLPDWWRQHGGGIPYVIFWTTFCFMILPCRRCVRAICVFVTTCTCLLEFMQLWQPEWLMRIRATTVGAALLGSGFSWSDFPPYFLGGALGYVILMFVATVNSRPPQR